MWPEGIYQLETSDPVLGGENGVDNRQAEQFAARTQVLKKQIADNKTGADAQIATKADKTTTLTAGNGLTGGGDLSTSRTLTLGTPGTLSGTTSNNVTATGHTHEIAAATAAVAGVTKVINDLTSNDPTAALSAAQGKALQDAKANKATTLAGYGITDAVIQQKATSINVDFNTQTAAGVYPVYQSRLGWGVMIVQNIGGDCVQVIATHYGKQYVRYRSNGVWREYRFEPNEDTGCVAFFAATAAPVGWLKANGATVSRATYSALFTAIGTRYGAGDGSTTFNLPDLRGEFLRGWDDACGIDPGRILGTAQTDAIRNITGTTPYYTVENSAAGTGGAFAINQQITGRAAGSGAYGVSLKFDASLVVPTAAENRPRNIALLACIKY